MLGRQFRLASAFILATEDIVGITVFVTAGMVDMDVDKGESLQKSRNTRLFLWGN
ncbi:MAG: hypothetical protein V4805_02970 [Pseudomonadota bacterium]